MSRPDFRLRACLRARVAAPLGLALALLLPACNTTHGANYGADYEAQDPFRRAIREGRLGDAKALAEASLAQNPQDAQALERVRDVGVMQLLSRARQLVFDDHPQAALDVLLEAQELDPGNPMVQVWMAKTRRNLADGWLEIASAYSGDADLDQAEVALRRALLYVPDDPQALADLERTLIRSAYRKGLSVEYFYGGLSALHEERFQSADRDLGISVLYDEANEDAARRREDVHRQLAQEGLALAYELESEGLFFAACNEFRAVLFHDPDNEEAQAGVERLEREVQAELHLREAEMMVLRGEFPKAHEELAQARELTLVQGERIDRFEGEIEAARWESLYKRAQAYAQDQRLEEAVEVLDQLLGEVESYADARRLRDVLVDNIENAARLYDEALATEDAAQALALLKQIEIYRRDWRDVAERITALEKSLEDPQAASEAMPEADAAFEPDDGTATEEKSDS